MGHKIIRQTYILMETAEMLYRFVNGISYRSLLSKRDSGDQIVHRLELLDEIMAVSCEGLDPYDPQLQRFFGCADLSQKSDGPCLARCLIRSFCSMAEPGFDESIAECCEAWHRLQEQGAWIKGYGTAVLDMSEGEGSPGELIEQICALDLPAEFQLSLYRALRNFDRTMAELAETIRPVAKKLEKHLRMADWMLSEVESYWKNVPVDPLDFLSGVFGPESVRGAGEHTDVIISAMSYNRIFYDMEQSVVNTSGRNFLYVGCGVTVKSQLVNQDMILDSVSATLKILSDKRRLDILRRLSKERSYCHELADIIGSDPGNMSRTLTLLHNYGFLQQQREAQRNYYQTDKKAICAFFQQVEDLLFR